MNKNTKSKKHYSMDFFLFEVQSPCGPPSNFSFSSPTKISTKPTTQASRSLGPRMQRPILRRQGAAHRTRWVKRTLEQMVQYLQDDRNDNLYYKMLFRKMEVKLQNIKLWNLF